MNLSTLPKTPKEAKALGLKHYYPGPCHKGHAIARAITSRGCPECIREHNRAHARKRRRSGLETLGTHPLLDTYFGTATPTGWHQLRRRALSACGPDAPLKTIVRTKDKWGLYESDD